MAFELTLQILGVLAHPDDHEGDEADGDEADHRLEPLLLLLRELPGQGVEPDADRQAQHDGGADTDPHVAQRIGPTLLSQEGRHDADDQRGLEALSQTDDEGGKH